MFENPSLTTRIAIGNRYFKLLGDDGGIYLLRQDTIEDRWEMTLYTCRTWILR